MKSLAVRRRGFVLGAFAALMSIPFYRRFIASAADPTAPQRLLFVYQPNGTMPDNFYPLEANGEHQLNTIMQPFAPFAERVTVIRGLHNGPRFAGAGDDHQDATVASLTGSNLQFGNGSYTTRPNAPAHENGQSVDQFLGARNALAGMKPSHTLAADPGGDDGWGRIAFDANGAAISPITDPSDFWRNDIEGEITTQDPQALVRRDNQRDILDLNARQLSVLRDQLGAYSANRLQSHLDAVSAARQRLDFSRTCDALGDPGSGTPAERFAKFMDMISVGFSCDLFRTATLQFNRSAGKYPHPELGVNTDSHHLGHQYWEEEATPERKQKIIDISHWFAQRVASLVANLEATPDVDGRSVMDNTLIVWFNEFERGHHSADNQPWVLIGNAGGALRSSASAGPRVVNLGQTRPHNDLLATLCIAFGQDVSTYGDPRYCTGSVISELL